MNDPTPEPTLAPKPISAVKAVIVGHLLVNLVAFLIIAGGTLLATWLIPRFALILMPVTFVLALLWWLFMIPRWRRWALKRGAPADRLQKLAVNTGLIWVNRSLYEDARIKLQEAKKDKK